MVRHLMAPVDGELSPFARAVLARMRRRFEAELGPERWAAEQARIDAILTEAEEIAREDEERERSGG